MTPPPIVIIGAARSGTKFLRDLLAESRAANAVPYDVNYVWRYGAAAMPDDALRADDLTQDRAGFIRRTLASLAGVGGSELVMIEKTVGNTLRVPYVAKVLPDARFVHLVRDGRDVTESAMRLWQAPPDWSALWTKLRRLPLSNIGYAAWFAGNFAKGVMSGRGGGKVWGPRYPGIETDAASLPLARVAARQWRHSVEASANDLAALPPDQVVEIRYEDLVAHPASLDRLIDWLELPDGAAVRARHARMVQTGHGGKWRTALNEKDLNDVFDEIGTTLGAFGYAR